MSREIRCKDLDDEIKVVHISMFPDRCPVCRNGISSVFVDAYELPSDRERRISIILKCPINSCKMPFVAIYREPRGSYGQFYLIDAVFPIHTKIQSFPSSIESAFPSFKNIFNQSFTSEINGLDEICGPGYRKALEFLIKDYLILKGHDKETISTLQLSVCIKKIEDKNIQEVAKRAAWLGNDETHYIRKWESHDLTNLKDLISLTVNFIDSHLKAEKYLKDMPE
jgi:hypothetical protein